jgi:hypothetical protein
MVYGGRAGTVAAMTREEKLGAFKKELLVFQVGDRVRYVGGNPLRDARRRLGRVCAIKDDVTLWVMWDKWDVTSGSMNYWLRILEIVPDD